MFVDWNSNHHILFYLSYKLEYQEANTMPMSFSCTHYSRLLILEILSVWIETKQGELTSLTIIDQEFSRGLAWVIVNELFVDLHLHLVLLKTNHIFCTYIRISKSRIITGRDI